MVCLTVEESKGSAPGCKSWVMARRKKGKWDGDMDSSVMAFLCAAADCEGFLVMMIDWLTGNFAVVVLLSTSVVKEMPLILKATWVSQMSSLCQVFCVKCLPCVPT